MIVKISMPLSATSIVAKSVNKRINFVHRVFQKRPEVYRRGLISASFARYEKKDPHFVVGSFLVAHPRRMKITNRITRPLPFPPKGFNPDYGLESGIYDLKKNLSEQRLAIQHLYTKGFYNHREYDGAVIPNEEENAYIEEYKKFVSSSKNCEVIFPPVKEAIELRMHFKRSIYDLLLYQYPVEKSVFAFQKEFTEVLEELNR